MTSVAETVDLTPLGPGATNGTSRRGAKLYALRTDTGLKGFQQRVRSALYETASSGRGSGGAWAASPRGLAESRLEVAQQLGPVRAACSFLDAAPEDFRSAAEVGELLEEYRELAALVQELLTGAEAQQASDPLSLPGTPLGVSSSSTSLSRSLVFTPSLFGTPRSG